MAGDLRRRHTVLTLRAKKTAGERIAMVTAYDAAQAAVVEAAGADVILVGDSVGMVMLGYETTIPVTLDDMVHHAAAARRGAPGTMLLVDMPFLTYRGDPAQTLRAAGRIMQEALADGVKIEGGEAVAPHVRTLAEAGIPVCAHLGLTPQSVLQFGGFRVQARGEAAAGRLLADARALEAAGAFLLVLECIPAPLAESVTDALGIPTIGIGAGAGCNGQVLVYHDLLGLRPDRPPRFVKPYAGLYEASVAALQAYCSDVRAGRFPDAAHSYQAQEGEKRQP